MNHRLSFEGFPCPYLYINSHVRQIAILLLRQVFDPAVCFPLKSFISKRIKPITKTVSVPTGNKRIRKSGDEVIVSSIFLS
jgi:hypothetical protein